MTTWRHKVTIITPASMGTVNGDITYRLEELLHDINAFSVTLNKDPVTGNDVVSFRGTDSNDIVSIGRFAEQNPKYGFIHQFADLKFEEYIGEVTYDGGEAFCEEKYFNPTFDDYASLGFKTKPYFDLKFQTIDSVKRATKNPDASELLLTALEGYLRDSYDYKSLHRLMLDIYRHRNFPQDSIPVEAQTVIQDINKLDTVSPSMPPAPVWEDF